MDAAVEAAPAGQATAGQATATRHRPSRARTSQRGEARRPGPLQVDVVVPVYNEAASLESSICTLRRFLDESFPFRSVVTIADNGSTDGTPLVAQRLASTLGGVRALVLTRKGRGFALRSAWSTSEAEIVAYMDADLSTSLPGLAPLVASVLSGHSDVAVGTRLAGGSRVVRGPKRELISRAYSHTVRLSLRSRITDFQCGFKALRRTRALELLPMVEDDGWFFDTELLVTAERLGMRIFETPVEWTDDPDSSVHIVATAVEDLRGIWRLARRRTRRRPCAREELANEDVDKDEDKDRGAPATADQLLSFAGVGVLSTLSYLLFFAAGWAALGPWAANAAALALCTLLNTALHWSIARRTSAPLEGGRSRPPLLAVVAALYGVSLAATSAALGLVSWLSTPTLVTDAAAVTLASCGAALVRFSLLRGWVFRPTRRVVRTAVAP